MPAIKPSWADLLPKIPVLVKRALDFANEGVYRDAHGVIIVDAESNLDAAWYRRRVSADLLELLSTASRRQMRVLDVERGSDDEGTDDIDERRIDHRIAPPATMPNRTQRFVIPECELGLDVLAAQQQLRARLRVCANDRCARWFIATDARSRYHRDECRKANFEQRRGARARSDEQKAYDTYNRKR